MVCFVIFASIAGGLVAELFAQGRRTGAWPRGMP